MTPHQPSGRTLVALFAIIALIIGWAVLIASLSRHVGQWPVLVQALFYLVAGLIWIVPLKPIIRWSLGRRDP